MKSGLSGPASLTSFVHPPPSRWGLLFFVPKPRTTRTSTPLRPPKTHAIGFSRPQATLKNECEANVMDFQPDVLFIDTISKSVYKAFIFLTGSSMYFIPISFY